MIDKKIEFFLDMAEVCAKQGTCLRRKYGAVIVDRNNEVISTGYNGAPCKQLDCLKIGSCWREDNNIPSGQNYEKCLSVHAEMNALLQAGRKADGATMYLVGIDSKTGNYVAPNPCFLCSKMIINSKIRIIIGRTELGNMPIYPKAVYSEHYKNIFGETND